MARVAETERLVASIKRLRRAEAVPAVAEDVGVVRAELEERLGPTLSRSRSARILGVSQTALDRWIGAGEVPTVITPTGRHELPARYVLELAESIDAHEEDGDRHPLAAALRRRAEGAEPREQRRATGSADDSATHSARDHGTADRRSLAYHRLIAERLSQVMVWEAIQRVELLAAQGRMHDRYAEAWRRVLSRPLPEIAAAIGKDDQTGRDLRQNSPFAGVLSEHERARIIAAVQ